MMAWGLLAWLCAASGWDVVTRTIPAWLVVLGAASLATAWGAGLAEPSWLGALLGYVGARWLTLSGGDAKALGLVGALVGVFTMLHVLTVLSLVGWSLVTTLGRRRSLLGVPAFPWMAGVIVVVLICKWYLQII